MKLQNALKFTALALGLYISSTASAASLIQYQCPVFNSENCVDGSICESTCLGQYSNDPTCTWYSYSGTPNTISCSPVSAAPVVFSCPAVQSYDCANSDLCESTCVGQDQSSPTCVTRGYGAAPTTVTCNNLNGSYALYSCPVIKSFDCSETSVCQSSCVGQVGSSPTCTYHGYGGADYTAACTYIGTQGFSNLPVINSFIASATTIVRGEGDELSWSTSNATTVSISGLGAERTSGWVELVPQSTITYTLTASNSSGSVSKSVTVSVTPTQQYVYSCNPYYYGLETLTVTPALNTVAYSDNGGDYVLMTFAKTVSSTQNEYAGNFIDGCGYTAVGNVTLSDSAFQGAAAISATIYLDETQPTGLCGFGGATTVTCTLMPQ
jgi:hypothetical protein